MAWTPDSDRHLDDAIALRAVRARLPALGCRRAERLGSGWATDAYLLDDRLVARFPRNAEAARWVDFDEAVLAVVASTVGSAFAVPAVVARGTAGPDFPYDFLVCELVRGVGADHVAEADSLAAELGRALGRVHAIPLDAARAAGVGAVEWDDYAGTPRFLHGDFRHGNVIVDPATGRLAGVIDWGNAALGDPALDFMMLVMWRGWDFMHRALAAYDLPTDDGFLDRVRRHAQMQSLQALADTVRRRADPEPHLGWLRNAFALAPTASGGPTP
jgi:aminoglycoside phosphotransferase (APT) family kinase protein